MAGFVSGYGPGKIDVTFHGDLFRDMVQRMPRVRFGRVHVYNNFYDLDFRSSADYRLGDTWILGTSAKIVTENNVIDVRNNSVILPAKIVNYSSTLANRQLCVDAGYTLAACGTYFLDRGTVVTSILPAGPVTQVLDIFAAAKVKQEANANNAPLVRLDPADPAVFWLPSSTYPYTAAPVDTAAEQEALRQQVIATAGAGKL